MDELLIIETSQSCNSMNELIPSMKIIYFTGLARVSALEQVV
jgi:hypothetical protein